jgi:lipopolysaccharide/colanic/teichoic acid biosynthesis glycosyltransferase
MGRISQLLVAARQWQNRNAGNADDNSFMLCEANFHGALRRECRRTERSKKLVLLMLASLEAARENENGHVHHRDLASVLAESSRETDILGWYRHEQVLGVLFTELGAAKEVGAKERKETVNSIERRMRGLLEARSRGKSHRKINFSFHFFPEDPASYGRSTPWASPLSGELRDEEPSPRVAQGIKRAIDIAGAMMALIVLSPLFVLVSILIKLTSTGPAFFRQIRVGQHGRQFTFLKFRSMYVDSQETLHREYVSRYIAGEVRPEQSADGKSSAYKIMNDPRVTPLGRVLRKTSIDELPQLLNVLKGDMSLVGPRPPIPYEFDWYEVWHLRRIVEVKPGITGLWQVCGRSKTTFDEMVRLDLRYARTWSLFLDFKILMRTFRTVFSGDGAY